MTNFRASRNDLRASTSWLQLAQRAGWKIKLLCTLQWYLKNMCLWVCVAETCLHYLICYTNFILLQSKTALLQFTPKATWTHWIRSCTFLVAKETDNWVLANTILRQVYGRRVIFTVLPILWVATPPIKFSFKLKKNNRWG